jgi:hypothetical protein
VAGWLRGRVLESIGAAAEFHDARSGAFRDNAGSDCCDASVVGCIPVIPEPSNNPQELPGKKG